jgi:hypothetical protein
VSEVRIKTHAERRDDLAHKLAGDMKVDGRTLPPGRQWNGRDVAGRGSAPARRLRQAGKLKKGAKSLANIAKIIVDSP